MGQKRTSDSRYTEDRHSHIKTYVSRYLEVVVRYHRGTSPVYMHPVT